jgi:hypothetical protein
MLFKRLFAITCNHQYFANNQCSHLQIEPTGECSALLKRYHMLYKQEDINVYSISIQQLNNEVNPAPPSSALTFYIFISSNEFYNYTKYPAVIAAADNTLLFSGADSSANSTLLTVAQTTKPPPLSYQSRKLFGIISIIPPKNFCNYVLTLEAIAIKWRYYIIADGSVKHVEVKEKDSPVDVAERITFTDITNIMQTDATYQAIKTSFPNGGVFLTESDAEVLTMQRPRKTIQLWNATDKDHELLLMDNLPIPTPLDNGQKIIYIQTKNNNV